MALARGETFRWTFLEVHLYTLHQRPARGTSLTMPSSATLETHYFFECSSLRRHSARGAVPPFTGGSLAFARHTVAHEVAQNYIFEESESMRLQCSKLSILVAVLIFLYMVRIIKPPIECRLVNSTYKSSKLEMAWIRGIHDWQGSSFCGIVHRYHQEFKDLLRAISADRTTHLSSFQDTYLCGAKTHSRTTFIEPLVAALRHPLSICFKNNNVDEYLLSKDYVVVQSPSSFVRGKRYLFDIGASLWNQGAGGASQSWLIARYAARGVDFDRIFLWEAAVQDPAAVFRDVPRELMHAYQYFNVPASADPSDPSNPLNILMKTANPSDFVVVKIDIDNWSMESRFLYQILHNPEISGLIDELMYEHHVAFEPLVSCCWKDTADNLTTLADSYALFLGLRRRGIRAHGWP